MTSIGEASGPLRVTSVIKMFLDKGTKEGGSFHANRRGQFPCQSQSFDGHWLQNVIEGVIEVFDICCSCYFSLFGCIVGLDGTVYVIVGSKSAHICCILD